MSCSSEASDENNEDSGEDNGISLKGAMYNLMNDPELSDVTLRCIDGTQVKANRSLLASRSSVFKKSLTGNFKEASSDVVDVGFNGVVVNNLIRFIATDGCHLLSARFPKIESLVELYQAGKYYDIGCLTAAVLSELEEILDGPDEMAIDILNFCDPTEDDFSDLRKQAFSTIKNNPTLLLESAEMPTLEPRMLEELVAGASGFQEISLFRLIQKWCDAPDAESKESRKRKAMNLIQHVNLDLISASDLSEMVSTSGLVPEKQVHDAILRIAIRAEEKFPFMFKRMRVETKMPKWLGVDSVDRTLCFDIDAMKKYSIQYPLNLLSYGRTFDPNPKFAQVRLNVTIPLGRCTWTFRINQLAGEMGLGVVMARERKRFPFDKKFPFDKASGRHQSIGDMVGAMDCSAWYLLSDGTKVHDGNRESLKFTGFGVGSHVHFVMERGKKMFHLKGSVSGGALETLFRHDFKMDGDEDFDMIPVVSVRPGDCLELMDSDCLEHFDH